MRRRLVDRAAVAVLLLGSVRGVTPLSAQGPARITELPNLVAGLRQRGWTDAEMRLAMGENWLRVYQRVFGA